MIGICLPCFSIEPFFNTLNSPVKMTTFMNNFGKYFFFFLLRSLELEEDCVSHPDQWIEDQRDQIFRDRCDHKKIYRNFGNIYRLP